MTISELKKIINNLPDDMPVAILKEMGGLDYVVLNWVEKDTDEKTGEQFNVFCISAN